MRTLLPEHRDLLDASAISRAIAEERDYWSAQNAAELERWFGPTQRKLVPALVIPVYTARGACELVQIRPDEPRVVKGKSRKYELPSGCRLVLDVPPRVRAVLGDPNVPLVITEGARKADSAVSAGLHAIAILGVTGWRGKNEHGGKAALADHELIAFNNRIVYLAFDSDAMVKREVFEALRRYRSFLERLEADVRIVYLPSGPAGAKVGLDDWFAAGHDRNELLSLASDELREPGGPRRGVRPAPNVKLRPTYELAHEIGSVLDRFVVLPNRAAALTMALYVLHSWAFDAAFATPYLLLQSAVKRSGKSRVEEVLEELVRTPWRIAATSESALFRKINLERPTLLMDELDATFGRSAEANEPVRAILNAGNRPGASVARTVGEGASMTVADFSVYCPKVLAGIGTSRWPDTVLDRSIIIQLRRKTPNETVERLRPRKLHAEVEPLRAELARWAAEHLEELRELEPEFITGLDDRAFEAWEPLLAIAELAELEGAPRFAHSARRAALILAGQRPAESDGDRVLALTAIRVLFEVKGADALGSGAIVEALNDDDQLPFGDYRKGTGIDGRGLARLLRPFAIAPHNVRIEDQVLKGYHRDQFLDAWERYCEPRHERQASGRAFSPREAATDALHRHNPNGDGRFGRCADPLHDSDVAAERTAQNPHEPWECSGVADETGQPGGEPRGEECSASSADGRMELAELVHEQRLERWRACRERHRRELEAGAPSIDELTAREQVEAFPGAEIEQQTDLDRAAEVIACALTGSKHVIGRWWPSKPIRAGLERDGIGNEDTIERALELLGVEVRRQGAVGARWRLEHAPDLPPVAAGQGGCGCDPPACEWRLVNGGPWICRLCHPPVEGLDVKWSELDDQHHRAVADERPPQQAEAA